MKHLILIVSDKGGVGKSTFARGLVDVLRSLGRATAAYDGDAFVGQVLAHYGTRDSEGRLDDVQDPLVGVGYFNARTPDGRERLYSVTSGDQEVTVVDLPGGSLEFITGIHPDGLDGFASVLTGVSVTLCYVVSTRATCTKGFLEFADTWSGRLAAVLTLDERGGTSGYRFFFGDGNYSNGLAAKALRDRGGLELHMPYMRDWTYRHIDARHDTFSAFVQAQVPAEYYGDIAWTKAWLRDFGGIVDQLVPEVKHG